MSKTKNKNNLRKTSLPASILQILNDWSDNISLFDSPYKRMKKDWLRIKGAPEFGFWQYRRAVERLEKSRYVKRIRKRDEVFLKLTKEGKIRALSLELGKLTDTVRKWDGKWRLIIWDIPEESHSERNKLRRLVKALGFYKLQNSVFIIPYQLPNSAVEYLTESGLMGYVRILRIDKIDNDQLLRKHFNL